MMGVIFKGIGKLIRNILVPPPAEKTQKFLSVNILTESGWRERLDWVVFKEISMVRKSMRKPFRLLSSDPEVKYMFQKIKHHIIRTYNINLII